MKAIYFSLITILLLCYGMRARADNIVTIGSAEGATDEEVTVSISLQNTDALSSLQMSIPLDENLTSVGGSAQVSSRCPNHSASAGVKDGALQVVVYSLSMATIAPGSGEIVSFRLKLGNEPLSATLQATEVVLTDGNGNTVNGSCQNGIVTIRCAKAQFGTDEVDFGRVPIRSTYSREVAVTNVGNADLVVSGLEFSEKDVFSSTTQLPKTITPGSTANIDVTFAPTDRGSLEHQLRIVSNSSTRNRAIRLKARPYAVNELHMGNASGISDEEVTISMRMNNMDDIIGYQMNFQLPSSLQYVDGSFEVSQARKQDHLGFGNIVDGMLRIMAYSPSGKPLKENDGEIGSFRVKLVGKNSVSLSPTETVLTAIINNKVENVVSDVYGGRVNIQYPSISTNAEINFGAVPVTEDCKQTFTIRNYGSAPLTINRIIFNNEYLSVAEEMPLVIPRWESRDVTVIYTGIEQKAFEAKMQIYSNDPDRRLHEVRITGSRFAPNYLNMTTPDIFEDEMLKINLGVNTYDDITGLQFDVVYPNTQYEPFDGNVIIADRANGMTVSSRQMGPNTIRYVCYFLAGGCIAAGEGDVMSISLKPVAGITPVGIYNVSIINVQFGTAELTDKYAGDDLGSSFKVKKHNPVTISANSYTRLYGDANPTFEYTSEGAVVVGQPEFSCEATVTSPVGVYPIHISKGSVTNEEDTYVDGTLTITRAPLTIAAGTYTKKQGEENPEFVLSYDGFKNNETKDVLTKQAEVVCDAIASSAPGEYPVTVSGADAQNYDISYVRGKLIVTDADPVIVTANSYTIAYGDTLPEFGYTYSGATLIGTPTISCEVTSASPVGTYPIVISKGSVTNYNDSYVNGTLTITKAPLTVSVGNYTRKQGETNPDFVISYNGFKNNETEDVLKTKPTATTSATVSSEPGEYEIVVSGGEAQNYELSYKSGKLTVIDADPVTITANSYTIEYGDAIPEFGYTSSGATLDGTPTISCEATSTSPVGTYPIIISKGSVTNYNDSYVNGTLTITKAPLTIAAGTYTKKQGEENPEFVLSYEGFKNNETKDVLTKQAKVVCDAIASSVPGEYPVTVSGAEAQNYYISYVDGKLVVTEADPIKLTAKSYTREYGEANPVFEFIVEGAALDGAPEIICEATATSPVGDYPIIIKKGSVKNYNDSYVNGTLTITKAPLTVTADDINMEEWSPELPTLTLTYEGWKNGEDESVLIEKPIATTSATIQSPVGEYPIVVSGGKAINYSFIFVNGILTITEPDGIESLTSDLSPVGEESWYDLSGRKIDKPQKGINIIRYSDGTTRKVLVK